MKITISKTDFKKESVEHIKPKKNVLHEKNASSQAKHYIRRNNTYKLEEKSKKSINQTSNLTYLLYFLFIVFTAVFVAGIWKLFITYSENSFTTKSFSVLVKGEDGSTITALNNETRQATILTLKDASGKRIKDAVFYGVPIDAQITVPASVLDTDLFTVPKFIAYLFRFSGVSLDKMTGFDYLKMVTSVSGMNTKDKEEKFLQVSEGELSLSEEELFDVFKDSDVIHEALGVEIVNATQSNGLAGRVAKVLSPIGVNIISLSSEDVVLDSVIKIRNVSKTASRISQLLDIPIVEDEPSTISDITIILGSDFEKKLQ